MNSASPLTPEMLARLVPFESMRGESQRDLARQARLLSFDAGEYVFKFEPDSRRTIYVLDGIVNLSDRYGTRIAVIEGGTDGARYGLAPGRQRHSDAICATDVRCLAIDSRLLDVFLTWDQSDALEVSDLSQADQGQSDDWMTQLLQTPTFQMVPPTNLQAIFMRMERLEADPGSVIVRQGEAGDYFYVLTEGRCLVTREQIGQKPFRLAQLEAGSCFGEEALLADSPRNATVSMLTHGVLMRLSKQDFQKLLNEPLSRRVSAAEARARVDSGQAKFLDVRLQSEFLKESIPGSINIPLFMLRMKLDKLDRELHHICICDTGRRSSVAAFILMQKGFEASSLDSGMDATESDSAAG